MWRIFKWSLQYFQMSGIGYAEQSSLDVQIIGHYFYDFTNSMSTPSCPNRACITHRTTVTFTELPTHPLHFSRLIPFPSFDQTNPDGNPEMASNSSGWNLRIEPKYEGSWFLSTANSSSLSGPRASYQSVHRMKTIRSCKVMITWSIDTENKWSSN